VQRQDSASGAATRFSVRIQRQKPAISDGCALLGPMFMVTSGSFREGRIVDVKSDFKGMTNRLGGDP